MLTQRLIAVPSDEDSSDRLVQSASRFQCPEFPDDSFTLAGTGRVIEVHRPPSIESIHHSKVLVVRTGPFLADQHFYISIGGSVILGATLLGVAKLIWGKKRSDGKLSTHTTPAEQPTLRKLKVLTPGIVSPSNHPSTNEPATTGTFLNNTSSRLDQFSDTDKTDVVPDLVAEDNANRLVATRSTKLSKPTDPTSPLGNSIAVASPDGSTAALAFATPIAIVTTMASAEDAIKKMDFLEQAGAKAGRTINQSEALQWALGRQTAELQVNASLAQEWRQYHYDHDQRTVDREIHQRQHEQTVELAQSDKDWWAKLSLSMQRYESTVYRSISVSVVGIVVLDVLCRVYRVYTVVSSFTDLMCFDPTRSGQRGDVSNAWSNLLSYDRLMVKRFGAAMNCGKYAFAHCLAVTSLCLSTWLVSSFLYRVGTPEQLLHMIRMVFILAAVFWLGWLPSVRIMVVGSCLVLAVYGISYTLVRLRFGRVRSKFQALGTPAAKLLTEELIWMDDAIFGVRVAPVIGFVFWCLALYIAS